MRDCCQGNISCSCSHTEKLKWSFQPVEDQFAGSFLVFLIIFDRLSSSKRVLYLFLHHFGTNTNKTDSVVSTFKWTIMIWEFDKSPLYSPWLKTHYLPLIWVVFQLHLHGHGALQRTLWILKMEHMFLKRTSYSKT